MKQTIIIFLLTTIFLGSSRSQTIQSAEQKTFLEIQKSYIDANVPGIKDFDKFLKRDLEKYFYVSYGHITAVPELLRDGPTQSGVSYPKFYLWIKVYKDNKLATEGAVRVEAIEKKRFEITDFVSIKEIKDGTKDIYRIFPGMVCGTIKGRL